MLKRKKSIFILGSVLIGVVTILVVMLALAGAGAVDTSPKTLVISSASVTKVYDGTTLKSDEWSISKGKLQSGHTAEVEVAGRQKTVGSCVNELSVKIYDAAGSDVTADYNILLDPGTLTVLSRAYEIRSASASKEYDGVPLTAESYIEASGSLAPGHSVRVSFSGSVTDFGTTENKFTARVYDEKNYEVTENYDMICVPGTLEVTKRVVTFKSGNASKEYDGTPLSDKDDISIVSGSLAQGHSAVYDASAEITEPGEKQNAFTARIENENGADVTPNYEISYLVGTLNVYKRAITVSSESMSKPYDGYPLVCDVQSVVSGAAAENHYISYSSPAEITVPGKISNTFIVSIEDADGNDVTGFYDITPEYGTLEITKRAVTLKSANDYKIYDGIELANTHVDIYAGELFYEHRLETSGNTTLTDVGSVQNTFIPSIMFGYNDVTEYYDVTCIYGTLTVAPYKIALRSADAAKEYDGTELTNEVWYTLERGEWIRHDEDSIRVNINDMLAVGFGSGPIDAGSAKNIISAAVTDIYGSDRTRNYELTFDYGTLEVTPINVAIETSGGTRAYNGAAYQDMDGKIVIANRRMDYYGAYDGKTLIDGDTITVSNDGSITDVGSTKNGCTVAFNGRNINNYNITYYYGTLEVTPVNVTIETSSATRVYDGSAFTDPSGVVVIDNARYDYDNINACRLFGGDSITVGNTGSITDVGSVKNACTVAFNGRNINNYNILYDCGMLEVTPANITVAADGATKIYDGTPLEESGWALYYYDDRRPGGLDELELLGDDKISVRNIGKIINVGSADNIPTVMITRDGIDKSYNYNILLLEGELTVTKRAITVRSADAQKQYDKEPLVNATWCVVDGIGPFVYDDLEKTIQAGTSVFTVSAAVDGSITEPGIAPNHFAYITVMGGGNDVTSNFDITVQTGLLSVTQKGGATLVNNGEPQGKVVLKLTADTDGRVYLKVQSYGDFEGQEIYAAPEYGNMLHDNYGYGYLASSAMEEIGKSVAKANIELIEAPTVMPYYMSENNMLVQSSDTGIYGDMAIYTTEYYVYNFTFDNRNDIIAASVKGEYTALERVYAGYVADNYLAVPSTTKVFLQGIIDEFKLGGADRISAVASVADYVRHAAKYNLRYNADLDLETDPVTAFLSKYREGVCRHYAAAATLILRTLGIPARYTVGYVASAVADRTVEVLDSDGHAWVEVYFDGIGWVAVEVTGSSVANTVKPLNIDKEYDGTPLDASVISQVQGLSKYTNSGYTYTAKIVGSRTEAGVSESRITELIIYDPTGAEYSRYENGVLRSGYDCDFTFGTGRVHVYKYKLTVKTEGARKEYDGTPLVNDNYTVVGGLQAGHTITDVKTTVMDRIGVANNMLTARVIDDNGNDVTDEYKITVNAGLLVMTAIDITVTSASAEADYADLGGAPLKSAGFTVESKSAVFDSPDGEVISIDDIIRGATVEVKTVGAQHNLGSSQNEIASVMIMLDGNDITDMFRITYVLGTLTVK